MSTGTPAAQPAGSQQAVVEAALVLLERMGLSPPIWWRCPGTRRWCRRSPSTFRWCRRR
jgi:hypothetical protein